MDKRFLVAIIMVAIGAGLASELVAGHHCDSTKTAPAVKVVRGPRGPQGPQGPVGPQGPSGQVPMWYLLALGLGVGLALGLAIGAFARQTGHQPMVVFNYPPAPGPAAPVAPAPPPPHP